MEKTETLTFRLSPKLKYALINAAAREHRSLTNMIEKLILEHCKAKGVPIG